jgi:hypothetical protein
MPARLIGKWMALRGDGPVHATRIALCLVIAFNVTLVGEEPQRDQATFQLDRRWGGSSAGFVEDFEMKRLVVALLFLISLVAAGHFMMRYTIWTSTPKAYYARNIAENSLKSQGVNKAVIRDVYESPYWYVVNEASETTM